MHARFRTIALLLVVPFAPLVWAQVPQMIHYQGRLTVDGINVDGVGEFRFALVDGTGAKTYWSCGVDAVQVPVSKGLYAVLLGGAGMEPIESSVFTNSDVRLRVWFKDEQLEPDQRIASVGYSLMAAAVADGAITSGKLAPGAIGSAQLAPNLVVSGSLVAGSLQGNGAGLSGVVPADNSVTSAKIANNAIMDADIHPAAMIWDTKLATIGTAGKVADSALSANVTKLGASIESAEITDGTITDADIGASGISGSKIVGGDLAAARLHVGAGNMLDGEYSSMAGGTNNVVRGDYSFMGGGQENTISNHYGVIAGGSLNSIKGKWSSIGGGRYNKAGEGYNDDYATIGGGWLNTAAAFGTTVGGGHRNSATASGATIAGGAYTVASGPWSALGGGYLNVADGRYAVVGGGVSNETHDDYASVGGGYDNRADYAGATVAGGIGNWAKAMYAAVAGGTSNTASGVEGFIGGGYSNVASGVAAVIVGGVGNRASGTAAFIGGGGLDGGSSWLPNTASGDGSTIPGGTQNSASGSRSTIGGGHNNSAGNWYATVPGGAWNIAGGQGSFAAGRAAKANHDGAFVWSDGNGGDVASSANYQFTARAAGGVRLYSNSALSLGVQLAPNATAWTVLSDRDAKQDIEPLDARGILNQLAALPISSWSYKADPDRRRYIGPMAQDFHAAFGLGDDDRRINALDADGVALAAIQGLHQELQEEKARNAQLEKRLADLEQRIKQGVE